MTSPFILVIFGATGDLAQHKLIPALFSLYKNNQLDKKFFIVGFARRAFTDQEYAHMLGDELEFHKDADWAAFSKHIVYQQGMFDEKEAYKQLSVKLQEVDKQTSSPNTKLFYLATPPDNYETILQNLLISGFSNPSQPPLIREGARFSRSDFGRNTVSLPDKGELERVSGVRNDRVRIIIEKPFGKDLQTARNLDKKLAEMFAEEQIFRVDHYLGKETVQNMLAFRFANGIFEPVWNRHYIDHVQITFAQDEGIGNRGRFFDGVGILRDIGQNHLLQLLAAVAMEQPGSFTKEGVRDARANAITAIRCPQPSEIARQIVRGQYSGYRREAHVAPDSQTETYVAMKLFVDTDRFSGVPFYLRAGKKMQHEVVEIKIVFIQTCHVLFKEFGCPEIGNVLTIRIQPDEGMGLRVIVKSPGTSLALETVAMKFSYHQQFGSHGVDAYEKVLLDIITGDQMLFNRSDELESSWQLISTILKGWEGSGSKDLRIYDQGSPGPQEGNMLIENDGRKWL